MSALVMEMDAANSSLNLRSVASNETVFSMGGILLELDPTTDFMMAQAQHVQDVAGAKKCHVSLSPLHRMESITEECDSPPIGVTVVQLLPDFDGSLEDMAFAEPVSYTEEELTNLQTEVQLDESLGGCLNTVRQLDPALVTAGFIPPCALQKIHDSATDDSVDSLNPDQAVRAFMPVIPDDMTESLSVTSEGFIQMNDYRISFDTMGGGRLSEVRVAFRETDQTQYAVKILSKKKLQNYNLLLRTSRNPLEEAYREIGILQRLDHPNVINLVEVVDSPNDEYIYIVFELLDQALMDLPTEAPFTEREARKFFQEILCGVEHLHSQRIVHRDLKPDNMLLSRDGTVKIADFGFCEELTECDDSSELESDSACEEVSAVHGTPAFTPPECLRTRNKPVSGFAIDMWSLGITLYSLVVGDVPFKGDSLSLLIKSINTDSVQYPDGVKVSPALRDLISRLLDKNPKTRIRMEEVKQHPWLSQTDDSDEDEECLTAAMAADSEDDAKHDAFPSSKVITSRPDGNHLLSYKAEH
ncbi:Calcium/calmodulin-dependent protein kinase kinase 2 [Hypsibius exemplaris]|uniref:Calcium/calmodulin-dependent protein kinase kinase 2 n=1 Tax=Hypsibius exemplaris TaxID=2072580 RepID=A0A1W0WPA1_HYPEX|nr:Calcium/calmodulin-dependent protein kinase kinase 2 [Hypsibius exemplaris]